MRLKVAPRTRLGLFETIGSDNPDGAHVFGELNQRFAEPERHHARLAKAYESARDDLVAGFPPLLSSVGFGAYLAVYEGDDLNIFFKVGQGREDYRQIDQLFCRPTVHGGFSAVAEAAGGTASRRPAGGQSGQQTHR